MDIRTDAQIKREHYDNVVREVFDYYRSKGVAKYTIVAAIAREHNKDKYGYTSVNALLASLKRTEKINGNKQTQCTT